MASAEISYGIGAAGLALAAIREWISAGDRRRARPVVVTNEATRRTLEGGRLLVHVFLTNESAASAFNIRFGINLGDVALAWKYDEKDVEPSRINVLSPGARWPEKVDVVVVIPDELVWALDGDPDEGRTCWASYQSPAGDWWYTTNPARRSEDLTVTRNRWWSSWSQRRRLARRLREGKKIQSKAIRDLRGTRGNPQS